MTIAWGTMQVSDIQPRWTKEKDKGKAWEEDYEPSVRETRRGTTRD